MSVHSPSHGAPVLLPHWEWRTFAPSLEGTQALIAMGTRLGRSEGQEISLLCLTSSHDVSIRPSGMALKWRKQVGQAGLELWDSVLESTFPCSRETVLSLFDTWGIPAPALPRASYTLETFLAEIIQGHPDLRVIEVNKHAEAFSIDGARCEWTHLIANQTQLECLCIEHEDPGLTLQVVQRLGLQSRLNTSYPVGLKQALHLNPQH